MPIEHINPAGLFKPGAFTQVVTATGGRQVHIAGQLPMDAEAKLVGPGDPGAQARQVFENLRIALEAAGATFADLVRLTIYLVDPIGPANAAMRKVRKEMFGKNPPPATTVVGVARLTVPDALLEVDATAVID
jgi:enamine deaminase RidA (YjgF/YER057c/UK114 family)